MTPVSMDLKTLGKPFNTVRDNWGTVQPYYINYLTSITFGNILMTFVAVIQEVIHHGFKFPRVHPAIEVEELKPSFEHPNEFVSAEELAAARVTEIEEREALKQLGF